MHLHIHLVLIKLYIYIHEFLFWKKYISVEHIFLDFRHFIPKLTEEPYANIGCTRLRKMHWIEYVMIFIQLSLKIVKLTNIWQNLKSHMTCSILPVWVNFSMSIVSYVFRKLTMAWWQCTILGLHCWLKDFHLQMPGSLLSTWYEQIGDK